MAPHSLPRCWKLQRCFRNRRSRWIRRLRDDEVSFHWRSGRSFLFLPCPLHPPPFSPLAFADLNLSFFRSENTGSFLTGTIAQYRSLQVSFRKAVEPATHLASSCFVFFLKSQAYTEPFLPLFIQVPGVSLADMGALGAITAVGVSFEH